MESQSKYFEAPRQKLVYQGLNSLTDAELLSLVLGSGTKEKPVLTLAREVLNQTNGLYDLGKQSLTDLTKVPGIGEAKALAIIASLEIGRRRSLEPVPERIIILTSKDAFEQMSFLSDLPIEEFWILLLRRNNSLIEKYRISSGGVSGTVVDAKVIFRRAVDVFACAIVLCHNHPSGNSRPSEADIKLTSQLKEAGRALDVTIVDHVIIAERTYFSFSDEGLL